MNAIPAESSAVEIGGGATRGQKRYTPEEDRRILAEWWQKEKRPALLADLGRTKAAVAQRYYFLLREMGITPDEHKRAQIAQAAQPPGPQPGSLRLPAVGDTQRRGETPWTPEREAFLWRQARAGVSFEEIAEVLGGVTPGECRQRYHSMLQGENAPSPALDRTSGTSSHKNDKNEDESNEDENEVWAVLAEVPGRLARLDSHVEQLSTRVTRLERVLEAVTRETAGGTPGAVHGAGGEVAKAVHELRQNLLAFLRLNHWEKIRQLPAFLERLDEHLQHLEG